VSRSDGNGFEFVYVVHGKRCQRARVQRQGPEQKEGGETRQIFVPIVMTSARIRLQSL